MCEEILLCISHGDVTQCPSRATKADLVQTDPSMLDLDWQLVHRLGFIFVLNSSR
jgi:hypothetical protein